MFDSEYFDDDSGSVDRHSYHRSDCLLCGLQQIKQQQDSINYHQVSSKSSVHMKSRSTSKKSSQRQKFSETNF